MIKHDNELWWRPGRVTYPVANFTGIIGTAGVSVGAHTGAPVQQEISTFGTVGVLLDTAADAVVHTAKIPYDLDTTKNVYARVVYTTGSADAADTITWRLLYTQYTPGVTALITPATALSTAITIQTLSVGTAYVIYNSPWGKINGGVLSQKAEYWGWLVELNAFAAGLTEDKFALDLEIMYSPKRLQGPDGMKTEAKAPLSMLGKVV